MQVSTTKEMVSTSVFLNLLDIRHLMNCTKKNGENHVYTVKALYINKKSQYGDAPVIATDECLVNAPSHLLDTVNEMILDEEVHEAANNGALGFTIYSYSTDKRKGTFYSIKWVDIEKE